jgi:hypothetical protein
MTLGSAPYFDLARRGWVPCVVSWDPETGRFTRVEGPDAFTTWSEAKEASRRRGSCGWTRDPGHGSGISDHVWSAEEIARLAE